MDAKYPTVATLLSLEKQPPDNDTAKVPLVLFVILLTHGLTHYVLRLTPAS
jgi:hypothetical protein